MRKATAMLLVLASVFSVLSLTVSSADSGAFGNGFLWELDDSGVLTVTGTGPMPDFPSYEDQPWRSYAASVKSVVLSSGITSVGKNSFAMCARLGSVSLPKGITELGDGAFMKCHALTFVDLPSSVTRIGESAFYDCWQLREIDIALFASYLSYIGDEAFAGCSSLAVITLPMRLTHIGESAFVGCSSLDGIVLPDKLSYLGRFAFQDCTSLSSINVPWQIKDLPDYVFFGCASLRKVTFGRYLRSVGKEAFLWCPSLKEIHFPLGTEAVPDHCVGYYYFDREYVPYEDVTVIAGSPAGINYAEKNSFKLILDDPAHLCEAPCPYCDLCTVECGYFSCYERCSGHTFPITGNVNECITWSLSEDFTLTLDGTGDIPSFTFDSVPWRAYKNAVNLAVISEGITSVGDYTFDSHRSLTEVRLPEGVTAIGRKAFSLCSALSGIELPESVETVGDYAFNGCSALEYVFFGDSLRTVGDYSFFGCVRLLDAVLPEGAFSVGEGAFESCPMLESFYLPESVETVGDYALGYLFSGDRRYCKNDNFKIIAPLFSFGQTYAEENGLTYERSDVHLCGSTCEVCGRCLDGECKYPECTKKCDAVCTAPWDFPFTDVKERDWYADSVRYVYLKGLFTGVTSDTFEPLGSVTRAQLAVVLWRLAGSPKAEKESPFEDVTASWYRDAVGWAYEEGVVTGKSGTVFDPSGNVTREQLVTMLARFYKNVLKLDTSLSEDIGAFPDAAEVTSYAVSSMSWAMAEGLITGKNVNGTLYLSPLAGATRAECAAIFSRLLKKL